MTRPGSDNPTTVSGPDQADQLKHVIGLGMTMPLVARRRGRSIGERPAHSGNNLATVVLRCEDAIIEHGSARVSGTHTQWLDALRRHHTAMDKARALAAQIRRERGER